MCGIFGIVTRDDEPLGETLLGAARRLSYRGYDSVGAATIGKGHIDLRKDVGRVDEVAPRLGLSAMHGRRGLHSKRGQCLRHQSRSQPAQQPGGSLVGCHGWRWHTRGARRIFPRG